MLTLTQHRLAMVPHLIRAIDWIPFAVAEAVIMCLAFGTSPGAQLADGNMLATTRMSAVLLAAVVSFALVDHMAATTAAVPTPRWLRMWLRTGIAGVAALAGWAVTLVVLLGRLAPDSRVTPGLLVLEAAGCVLTGLAITAVLIRRRPEQASAVAGAAGVLVLATGSLLLRERVWPTPEEAGWDHAHLIWWAVVPVALVLLGFAHRGVRR